MKRNKTVKTKVKTILKTFLLAVCIFGFRGTWAQVEDSSFSDKPLTQEQVRDFLKTNILERQLQKQIQAREGEFNTLEREEVKVFYERRAILLKDRGWNVKEYEEVQNRIYAAVNALEDYEGFLKKQADHQQKAEAKKFTEEEGQMREVIQKMLKDIEENEFLTKEQKQKAMADGKKMLENIEGSGIERKDAEAYSNNLEAARFSQSKPDWPAVKPYVTEIDQLVKWSAGGRENPPEID